MRIFTDNLAAKHAVNGDRPVGWNKTGGERYPRYYNFRGGLLFSWYPDQQKLIWHSSSVFGIRQIELEGERECNTLPSNDELDTILLSLTL